MSKKDGIQKIKKTLLVNPQPPAPWTGLKPITLCIKKSMEYCLLEEILHQFDVENLPSFSIQFYTSQIVHDFSHQQVCEISICTLHSSNKMLPAKNLPSGQISIIPKPELRGFWGGFPY